jgi:gas vesicle protein
MVDRLQAQFSAGVQRGRGMDKSQVDELTTGLVYTASEAKKLGLIDGIQSLETTLQQLQKAGRKAQTPRSVSMSETVQPVAATYKEIVAACSGIDAANAEDAMFITDAMRRELTASQASSDWCKTLKARADAAREELDAKSKELENARSEAAKPSPAKGVPTVGTRNGKDTESSHADALSEWNEEVDRHVKAGISRSEAVKKAAKRRPDLQKAVVGMANGNYQAN